MNLSEVMMIEVMFHFSHYQAFKDFCKSCILGAYQTAFPKAAKYNTRLLGLKHYALMPLAVFITSLKARGLSYIMWTLKNSQYLTTQG